MSILSDILSAIANVLNSASKPTKIIIVIPVITKKGIIMPNYELKDDTVATVPIQTTNSQGVVEPVPAGDVFTAVSSLPASLGVSVVTSPVLALVLTPLVQASPGITVTVSDSAGLAVATQLVDIVTDNTDTNIILNLSGATTTPQPVPTAPGP